MISDIIGFAVNIALQAKISFLSIISFVALIGLMRLVFMYFRAKLR